MYRHERLAICFGHWNLIFVIYLEFDAWNL